MCVDGGGGSCWDAAAAALRTKQTAPRCAQGRVREEHGVQPDPLRASWQLFVPLPLYLVDFPGLRRLLLGHFLVAYI